MHFCFFFRRLHLCMHTSLCIPVCVHDYMHLQNVRSYAYVYLFTHGIALTNSVSRPDSDLQKDRINPWAQLQEARRVPWLATEALSGWTMGRYTTWSCHQALENHEDIVICRSGLYSEKGIIINSNYFLRSVAFYLTLYIYIYYYITYYYIIYNYYNIYIYYNYIFTT
jgi:hypothetical protein